MLDILLINSRLLLLLLLLKQYYVGPSKIEFRLNSLSKVSNSNTGIKKNIERRGYNKSGQPGSLTEIGVGIDKVYISIF